MSFVHRITPRLDDIDRGGVVFFARYYQFCHVTLEEMLATMLPVPLEEAFASGLWCTPVVHSEAEYRHPLRLGEACDVRLAVENVGRTSISYVYTITRADGTLCATVRLVHVSLDAGSKRPVPLPELWREGLQRMNLWPPQDPAA